MYMRIPDYICETGETVNLICAWQNDNAKQMQMLMTQPYVTFIWNEEIIINYANRQ